MNPRNPRCRDLAEQLQGWRSLAIALAAQQADAIEQLSISASCSTRERQWRVAEEALKRLVAAQPEVHQPRTWRR